MKAGIASRALIGAGLVLAWLGLLLPWWAIGGNEAIGGFEASRAFAILLAPATVLALLAAWREWRWALLALAVAAVALTGIAVREIGAAASADSAFVPVGPGAGAILSLVGAAALVASVIVALRPPLLQLAGGLALFALVTGGAAALPQDGGRPGDGAIADAAQGPALAIAFQGDTLYRIAGGVLYAVPAPNQEYRAGSVSDEYPAAGFAIAGDTAYVALADIDRLVAVRPGDEPATVADDLAAGPLAAGPDGSIYVLQGDAVARWRAGEVRTLAPRFNGAQAIAVDARGALFVADTGNGRVHRIDPDGGVETVVGTGAPRACVDRGLDDPLALDPRRCTAVRALAVDRAGNLFMALDNAGMIVGLEPDGRMGVVAGTGPKGFGGGDAAAARLGEVDALAVGPDGDLYVSESDPVRRVRRIADPAGILAAEPPEPERPQGGPACAEIAAVNEAAARADGEALERALNALADAAPEDIAGDVDAIAANAADLGDLRSAIRAAMKPGVGLGEHAELECGLVGGFDVPVEEANAFCLAHARYRDRGDLVEAGEDPPRALDDVLAAAPDFLAEAGRDALRELENAAGRAVPVAEAELLLADFQAIDAAASAMCVVH